MQGEFIPTKANLIKTKESLAFSENGFMLLDKKRTVLIREAMSLVDKANRIQSEVSGEFQEAYKALMIANITMGVGNIQEVALSIPISENFEILYRSVMGLDIPIVSYELKEESTPSYGFLRTNAAMDIAIKKFEKIKYLVYELSEVENAVYKVSAEIKKTAKRANALEKIQIPRYKNAVKYIQDVIEEKEREDFFRLKKVKNFKIKKLENDK